MGVFLGGLVVASANSYWRDHLQQRWALLGASATYVNTRDAHWLTFPNSVMKASAIHGGDQNARLRHACHRRRIQSERRDRSRAFGQQLPAR